MQGHHPYQPPQPPPTNRTNQMAIASVIAGALGWVGVPIAASLIAIVCGHMARQQIRKTGEEGDGLFWLNRLWLLVVGLGSVLLTQRAVAASLRGEAVKTGKKVEEIELPFKVLNALTEPKKTASITLRAAVQDEEEK